MDKLKKQILIALAMLLVAAGVTLVLLLNGAKQTVLQEEQALQPAKEAAAQAIQQTTKPAGQEAQKEPMPPSPEEELARLLDNETYTQVLTHLKRGNPPAVVRPAAITSITNRHNIQAMHEIQEYQKLVEQIWQKYRSQPQQMPETTAAQPAPAAADALPNTPALSSANNWQTVPCKPEQLPQQNAAGLVCKESKLGFCALFENDRPYYCQTQDGQRQYLLNKWSSTVTVTHKGPIEKIFHYENGKLTQYAEANAYKHQISRLWLASTPLRLTQTDQNGKVLNKYYFTPNKPYIHYPGGNDMGEQNGPWEIKDGQIWVDGQPLLTLPKNAPAPDVCALFPGACAAQTQAQ